MKSLVNVQLLKIPCEKCRGVNFHPVYENKLLIDVDEVRRCPMCGQIISRDQILEAYSRIQPRT